MDMQRDKAEKQMRKAKEMLGISDERAEEIFQQEPDRKQQKRKELEQEGEVETDTGTDESADREDYSDVLEGTVEEAKEEILGMEDPDYGQLIEQEKDSKNRKTLIRFLKRKQD